MFIGHFGVAFAAKKAAPKISLGVLFIACQLMDLVWPVLVLLGIEKVSVDARPMAANALNFEYYPFTHSLVGAVLLSMIFRWIYFAFTKDRKTSWIVSTVVLSHWVLDWIVHRPDLPLSINNTHQMGLGLWNSVIGTVIVECAIFFGGYFLYWKTMKPVTPAKRGALWGMVAFLMLIFVMSIWGPQPELGTSGAALTAPALAMWILVPWAWWVDSRRKA